MEGYIPPLFASSNQGTVVLPFLNRLGMKLGVFIVIITCCMSEIPLHTEVYQPSTRFERRFEIFMIYSSWALTYLPSLPGELGCHLNVQLCNSRFESIEFFLRMFPRDLVALLCR